MRRTMALSEAQARSRCAQDVTACRSQLRKAKREGMDQSERTRWPLDAAAFMMGTNRVGFVDGEGGGREARSGDSQGGPNRQTIAGRRGSRSGRHGSRRRLGAIRPRARQGSLGKRHRQRTKVRQGHDVDIVPHESQTRQNRMIAAFAARGRGPSAEQRGDDQRSQRQSSEFDEARVNHEGSCATTRNRRVRGAKGNVNAHGDTDRRSDHSSYP